MKHFISLMIILLCMIIPLSQVSVLVIEQEDNGDKVAECIIHEGETVSTDIEHSVQKTHVIEYYSVHNNQLHLVKTAMQDLGWGMPSTLDEEIEFTGDYMVIKGLDRILDPLYFRVSYRANPVVSINGNALELKKVIPDETLLMIHIRQMPYIVYWFQRYVKI